MTSSGCGPVMRTRSRTISRSRSTTSSRCISTGTVKKRRMSWRVFPKADAVQGAIEASPWNPWNTPSTVQASPPLGNSSGQPPPYRVSQCASSRAPRLPMGASTGSQGTLPRTDKPSLRCVMPVMVPPTRGLTVTRRSSLAMLIAVEAVMPVVLCAASFDGTGHQAADEMLLENYVEDEHRRAGDHHAGHGQRHLVVVAPLEDADAGHQRPLGILLKEDDGDQEIVPDIE